MTLPSISVIVRTHNINRLRFLRRAVMSLAVQQNVRVEIIVATQRFSEEDIQKINDLMSKISGFYSTIIGYKIVNVSDLDHKDDLRVELLNKGISVSGERYIAFLDDDDLMYHFAYEQLISDLSITKSAVAFGRCVRVEGDLKNEVFYPNNKTRPYKGASKFELMVDNFCPIHSYIMDRNYISPDDLYFDELSFVLEDYRLLLRLASKYQFTFLSMNEDVCEYWFYSDNMNTTNQSRDPFSKMAKEWRKAYSITQKLKSEIGVEIKLLDFEIWARTRLQDIVEAHCGSKGVFAPPNEATIDRLIEGFENTSMSKDIVLKNIKR